MIIEVFSAKSPTRKSPKPGAASNETAPGANADAAASLEANAAPVKELELHERGIIAWNYVTGIGEQLITNSRGEREKTDDLKYYTASDPETMEALL